MNKYAVIVAGGAGSRMGTDIAKQYLPLRGMPILMHTLQKFHHYDATITIILVIPGHEFDYWKSLCQAHDFNMPYRLVAGGSTRFQSVKNGLKAINDEGVVAIHDGVRPLVDRSIIHQSYLAAEQYGAAVAAVDLKDSIRKVEGDLNKQCNRAQYKNIQTPQTFTIGLIKDAFEVEELPHFTDDASVAEHAGHPIHLFDGSYKNIKITTIEDIKIAEALL